MRHGRQASAYQILNPGFQYWFDDTIDAVAGYVRRGGWWAVGGGPVCPAEVEGEACRRLEAAAARDGCRVVYVCGDDTLRRAVATMGHHAAVTLGAEPMRRPELWSQRLQASASLRQQLSRARNKGVTIDPLTPAELAANVDKLKAVVVDWLTTRPLPAMRFLNDPRTLDGVLTDRRVWVARRGGVIIAFLLASPVVRRNGYLMEQIARRHDAPNGTAELLIDAALNAFAAEGHTYATLGMVVLSSHVREQMAANPPWLRTMFAFARAHGRRFYNYDGLERFREKLRPDAWDPIYLISSVRPFPFAALYAAGAAFCGERSPLGVVGLGVGKAVATEATWASAALGRKVVARVR